MKGCHGQLKGYTMMRGCQGQLKGQDARVSQGQGQFDGKISLAVKGAQSDEGRSVTLKGA